MCMYVVSVSINDQWIIYFLCTLTKGHRRSRTRKYSNLLLYLTMYIYLWLSISRPIISRLSI